MSISVFVADDHAIVRDGLTTLLRLQPGITVVGTASGGRETVEQVLRLEPQVLILDISMPGLNGIEAARQIVARRPQVSIVVLTMHSKAELVLQALEAGARGYVLKECATAEIIDAVRAVSAGRRFLSARVAETVAESNGRCSGVAALHKLSRREREVLRLVADGHTSVRIGEMLQLSSRTVDSYRGRLMEKLQVSQLAGLIKFAIQHGLTSLD